MMPDKTIVISREELFQSSVEETLLHQKALEQQVNPTPLPPVPLFRRLLLSNLFYTPVFAILGAVIGWMIIEPFINEQDMVQASGGTSQIFWIILFPFISAMIVMFMLIGEGLLRGALGIGLQRGLTRGAITFGLSLTSLIPIGLLFLALVFIVDYSNAPPNIRLWRPSLFLVFVTCRSISWSILGLAVGLGMYLGQGTRAQLRSAVLGGAIGGALGGLFFDPIDRFIVGGVEEGYLLRLIGLSVIGLCIGIFVALSEQLSREGWFRVKTGPLAGKSFILHRDTTTLGSTPHADIYLFKDAEIDPKHAVVYRVGASYEIEDGGSRHGTLINGFKAQRHRLVSGDQVLFGATVLEFEERAKRTTSPRLSSEGGISNG